MSRPLTFSRNPGGKFPLEHYACSKCLDFGSDHPDYDRGVEYPLAELLHSADNGCHTCSILVRAVQAMHKIDDESGISVEFSIAYVEGEGRGVSLRIQREVPRGLLWLRPTIELYCDSESPRPWEVIPQRAALPKDTSSPASCSWAAEQLQVCSQQHRECRGDVDLPLPTRVVDVGVPSSEDVRVVVTNGMGGQYVALSHCWGDPKLMTTKLTAHTLESYQGQVPFGSLPKTFQDAVTFTRKLGIRYLWIDSLCIIQKDEEKDSKVDVDLSTQDWKRESAMMCSVYENAHLTLAAASSIGSTSGLFYAIDTIILSGVDPVRGQYEIRVRAPLEHHQDAFRLLNRGWATQETLLSPRTLFFGRQELIWHCRESKTCQCAVDNLKAATKWWRLADEFDFVKLPKRDLCNSSYTGLNPMAEWYKIISIYSRTVVSFQSDKLAAIQGIAEYMSPLRAQNAECIAGLWSDTLAGDLCWATTCSMDMGDKWGSRLKVGNGSTTPWSSDKWLFPTWSWASNWGRVSWITYHPTREAQALVERVTGCLHPHYQLWLQGVTVRSSLGEIHEMTFGLASRELAYGTYHVDTTKQLEEYGPDREVLCLRVLESIDLCVSLVLACTDEDKGEYERLGLLALGLLGARKERPTELSPDVLDRMPFWWKGEAGREPQERTIILV